MNELSQWETAMVAEMTVYTAFIEALDDLSDETIAQLAAVFEAYKKYRAALTIRKNTPNPLDTQS